MTSGIQVNEPYCLFLIDTCSKRLSGERVIDYKLFFNTAIKTKISTYKQPFNDEQFIIDHFWRAKFPNSVAPGLRSPSPELLMLDSNPT